MAAAITVSVFKLERLVKAPNGFQHRARAPTVRGKGEGFPTKDLCIFWRLQRSITRVLLMLVHVGLQAGCRADRSQWNVARNALVLRLLSARFAERKTALRVCDSFEFMTSLSS